MPRVKSTRKVPGTHNRNTQEPGTFRKVPEFRSIQSQLPGRGRELISQSMHVFKICMEAQSFQGSADGSRRRLFGELFSERLHDILWKVLMHGEQLVQPLREVIGAFGACHA
jgi:hypothetical protein